MKDLPTLLTPHLVLRPLRPDDAPQIAALAGNRNVSRFTRHIPFPYDEALASQFIREQRSAFNKGEEWTWAVCLKDGLTLVGCISVTFAEEMSGELGYWIGEPYWNKGYATEAARAVANHVFSACEIWELESRHLFGNDASGRVLTKLGFQVVGFTQENSRGTPQNIVLYRQLRAAWIARPDRETFV